MSAVSNLNVLIVTAAALYMFFRLENRWDRQEERDKARHERHERQEERDKARHERHERQEERDKAHHAREEENHLHAKVSRQVEEGTYYALADDIWTQEKLRLEATACECVMTSEHRTRFYQPDELKKQNHAFQPRVSICGICSKLSEAHIFPKFDGCHIFHGLAAKFVASGEAYPTSAIDYANLLAMVNCKANKIPLPPNHEIFFDTCKVGHLIVLPVMTMEEIRNHKIGSSTFDVLVTADSERTMKWMEMKFNGTYQEATCADIEKSTTSLSEMMQVLANHLTNEDCNPMKWADFYLERPVTPETADETLSNNKVSEGGGKNSASTNRKNSVSDKRDKTHEDKREKAIEDNKSALAAVRDSLCRDDLLVPSPAMNSSAKKVLKLKLGYAHVIADPLALLLKGAMVYSSMVGQKLLPGCSDEDDEVEDALSALTTDFSADEGEGDEAKHNPRNLPTFSGDVSLPLTVRVPQVVTPDQKESFFCVD